MLSIVKEVIIYVVPFIICYVDISRLLSFFIYDALSSMHFTMHAPDWLITSPTFTQTSGSHPVNNLLTNAITYKTYMTAPI
jgi:hypothetical protein